MTSDEIVAALEAEGWTVWNIVQSTRGQWSCRLLDTSTERRTAGARGAAGFDRECWRTGRGPSMAAALGAAALGILQPQLPMEEPLDLDALLG